MTSIATWWMWVGFCSFIGIMLTVDLFILGGRHAKPFTSRHALAWVIVWFSLASLFTAFLYLYLAHTIGAEIAAQKALEFFTGYLLEESLSIDNMFVFVLIFQYFAVPQMYQHRVLMYGILGAIVMRLIIILLGIWLITKFHWLLYVFGAFLAYTGIKMLLAGNEKRELASNPLLVWLQNHLRITKEYHGEHFYIIQNNRIYFTPLFIVLMLIEGSDLIFAMDSIPAVFAVTKDPYIVFTSNIFAILGLRALYFLLASMAERFHLLKYGIGFILVFIGAKMLVAYWWQVPIALTFTVIAVTLLSCIGLSMLNKRT